MEDIADSLSSKGAAAFRHFASSSLLWSEWIAAVRGRRVASLSQAHVFRNLPTYQLQMESFERRLWTSSCRWQQMLRSTLGCVYSISRSRSCVWLAASLLPTLVVIYFAENHLPMVFPSAVI